MSTPIIYTHGDVHAPLLVSKGPGLKEKVPHRLGTPLQIVSHDSSQTVVAAVSGFFARGHKSVGN